MIAETGYVLKDGTRKMSTIGRRVKCADGFIVEHELPGGSATSRWTHLSRGWELVTEFRLSASVLEQVDKLVRISTPLPAGTADRMLGNRRDVWLPTGQWRTDGTALPDGPAVPCCAENMAAIFKPGQAALIIGARLPARQTPEIVVTSSTVEVLEPVDWAATSPLRTTTLLVRGDLRLLEAMEWYGRQNRLMDAGRRATPRVWSTWDFFQGNITQVDVEKCLELIKSDAELRANFDTLALDDGWSVMGDAAETDKFPDLAGMAKKILAAGMTPGIWLSPLRADAQSAWVKGNPDTVLWGEPRGYYPIPQSAESKRVALDYTHPKVREKIRCDLKRLRAMGFGYFKTDFLQAPNTNFRRPKLFDAKVTPVEGLRECMMVVREAIGHESYWLACGTEPLALAGLPDAARVSDDVDLRFGTLHVSVRNIAANSWMNGNLWVNDPDFLVLRGRETATRPLFRSLELGQPPRESKPYARATIGAGEDFSLMEAKAWASFHMVAGGTLTWSDAPDGLNAAGRRLLSTVLKWQRSEWPGIPLDIESANLPSLWLRPHDRGWLLGIINWADETREFRLGTRELERIGKPSWAFDVWKGERTDWPGKGWALEAHDSLVLHLEFKA